MAELQLGQDSLELPTFERPVVATISRMPAVTEQERELAKLATSDFERANYDSCLSNLGRSFKLFTPTCPLITITTAVLSVRGGGVAPVVGD